VLSRINPRGRRAEKSTRLPAARENRWNGVFDRTHDKAIEHCDRSIADTSAAVTGTGVGPDAAAREKFEILQDPVEALLPS